MRLVITAGYDGSKAAIALCELLTRQGHEIHSVIVNTPFSYRRLKRLLLKQGVAGLKKAIGKLRPQGKRTPSLLEEFLRSENIQCRSLKSWCKDNACRFVSVKSINSSTSVEAVNDAKPDALIYAGGGILRKKIIAATNGNILNCHSGPLPEIRGMNAIEWAVLLNQRTAVTIHKIDQGIDTGEIVSIVDVPVVKNETIVNLRDRSLGVTAGRQCYIMAPAISELLQRKLSSSADCKTSDENQS